MFCFQCQETAGNTGCRVRGVCGKLDTTANLQDLLVYVVKGIALYGEIPAAREEVEGGVGRFVIEALFATITNANFDEDRIMGLIKRGLKIKADLASRTRITGELPPTALWTSDDEGEIRLKAAQVGVLATEEGDVRSLRELLLYGLKGIAAYADHAAVLGYEDTSLYLSLMEALASTTKELSVEELTGQVMKAGELAVTAMALLDRANTSTYGHPEITSVDIGAGPNPGILISGHDLKDMEQLLDQTESTGVDVYTHGEMLPANYYPAFKKYSHFHGNYGNAWWKQDREFASFNGPILMTTNCIVPVKDAYRERIFTTGMAGYPGVPHIEANADGTKDFSRIIGLAKTCPPPREIETGEILGGFAHNQVSALADRVVEAVKSGAIKRFVVMAGCDGRQRSREYFTDLAGELPKDTIILTAGCAKYRYNKLNLGEIGGIPRVLDAGQCNDSYSLAVIAMKLKEAFGLESLNDLPLSFDIGWYEQKALAVLLALLHLGVRGIRLGPTLPAFLSPGAAKILVENFDIKAVGGVKEDVQAMMAGA